MFHYYFGITNIELLSFFVLSFFVAITPGPSVIYVVSYSLRYGAKAGVVSTLGINLGSVVAILIAAFGLSYILEAYPATIAFIQIVGGLYIIYLAYQIWPRGSSLQIDEQNIAQESYGNLFKNGFITSLLNPKDILFYTAFIPTFIPQSILGSSYQIYFLLLAFSYMLIGFITKSMFAVFAGYTKSALHSNKAKYVNYISSLLLLALGLYLAANALKNLIL